MDLALLLLLTLLTNAADGAYTCHTLRSGGRELNPFLGQSCARVISIKAGIITTALFLPTRPRRWVLTGAAIGGGVGLSISLLLKD